MKIIFNFPWNGEILKILYDNKKGLLQKINLKSYEGDIFEINLVEDDTYYDPNMKFSLKLLKTMTFEQIFKVFTLEKKHIHGIMFEFKECVKITSMDSLTFLYILITCPCVSYNIWSMGYLCLSVILEMLLVYNIMTFLYILYVY